MTVNYSRQIATIHYGSFPRLLFMWRGSVYKLVWPGLLMFCLVYTTIALTYHFLPSDVPEYRAFKIKFVQICAYAGYISNAIPISFVLGFYVNLVVGRWTRQFANLPTPDGVCLLLSSCLQNDPKLKNLKADEDKALIFRRTITRYINLSTALCFSSISLSMKRRFPTPESLVLSGLMTEQELEIYTRFDDGSNCFYIPLVWAVTLITKAHHENMIKHDRQIDALLKAIVEFWEKSFNLFLYDWVNVPLVYNQVVALAVYIYFAVCVISHQFIDAASILKTVSTESGINVSTFPLHNQSVTGTITGNSTWSTATPPSALDVVPNIPIFTILTFIFYNGWFKVAESHVFPFGLDDDDFEIVPLVERNLTTGLCFVDTLTSNPDNLPDILKSVQYSPEYGEEPSAEMDYLKPATTGGRARKFSRPTAFGDQELAGLIESGSEEMSEIPELPCPESIRRKMSTTPFCGSMGLVYGDENTVKQEVRNNLYGISDETSEPESTPLTSHTRFGSVGAFFTNLGKRFSSDSGRQSRYSMSSIDNHSVTDYQALGTSRGDARESTGSISYL